MSVWLLADIRNMSSEMASIIANPEGINNSLVLFIMS